VDFTKGLGAPIGAVLVGSRELIDEAWRYKQMWGGAMRQSGIVAAACLYALDHHVDRLAEDHENALFLAEGLAQIPGVTIDPSRVETNIVIFQLEDAVKTSEELRDAGVQLTRMDARWMRAVTHLDVSRADIEKALQIFKQVLG
jgi:threonine aldolase